MDLRTRYLGLELRSPLVASASPLTGNLDGLRRLEQAGAGAVVLPSLFEEQVTHELLETERLLLTGADSHPEAASYLPEMDDYNHGPWAYLSLVQKATKVIGIPVIASLNGVTPGGWTRHARWLEEAGAAAIELNLYQVAVDSETTASELEARDLEVIREVRDAVRIPLAVKVGPFFTAMANMAGRMVEAGAGGLVLFNRFYQPDLDLQTMRVVPRVALSTPEELRLPLRLDRDPAWPHERVAGRLRRDPQRSRRRQGAGRRRRRGHDHLGAAAPRPRAPGRHGTAAGRLPHPAGGGQRGGAARQPVPGGRARPVRVRARQLHAHAAVVVDPGGLAAGPVGLIAPAAGGPTAPRGRCRPAARRSADRADRASSGTRA